MAKKTIVVTKPNTLTKQGIGMVAGLAVQYLLGITANLFVSFPDTTRAGQLWQFAWTQIPVALHIIVGLLLLVNAVVLFIRSMRIKDVIWSRVSGVGMVAILIAVWSGVTFIPTQADSYSYIMAISFIVATLAYIWGIYASKIA